MGGSEKTLVEFPPAKPNSSRCWLFRWLSPRFTFPFSDRRLEINDFQNGSKGRTRTISELKIRRFPVSYKENPPQFGTISPNPALLSSGNSSGTFLAVVFPFDRAKIPESNHRQGTAF